MKLFCQHHFLWAIVTLSSQHFLHLCYKLVFTEFLWLASSLEGCGIATYPTAASFRYNSIDSDFIPSIVLVVVSLRLFHLCRSVPCFDYSFYKMWILQLGDNTTLLSVCELNNRCALTSHWPWKKWYGHWSWSTSLTYRVIRGLKSVAKLILYAITRS